MPHTSYHSHPIRSHGHGHAHAHRAARFIQSRGEELLSATGEATVSTNDNDSSSFAADLRRRDGPSDDDSSDTMINLLLIVLGLVFVALLAMSALYVLRRRRQRLGLDAASVDEKGLPTYSEAAAHNPRGLTIETKHNGQSSTIYIGRDGQPMLANPNSPPHSPDNVPEIHITFPDEHDANGATTAGRVLVVRVGDNASVGLEPIQQQQARPAAEDQLPAYERDVKDGFYSVDMDHIGGLKEKDPKYQ